MNTTRCHPRWTFTLTGALILATFTPVPASARQEPGPRFTIASTTPHRDGFWPLTRMGTQLVRCDNLTGSGITAPIWIPQAAEVRGEPD